jgi:hypothetical protein
VKVVTVPPGGRYDGLNEVVAPSGVPCTASVIGLANAEPCMATEKLNVAALPAGTDCEVAPVAVSVKLDVVPTTMLAVADVLERKFESPEYTALTLCVPSASELVLKAAAPADRGAVDNTVAPSSKVMLPVGTPLVVLDAWIVSVMVAPTPGMVVEADIAVSVGACAMVSLAGAATAE